MLIKIGSYIKWIFIVHSCMVILDEEVYMQLPPGFETLAQEKVCRLHKS